MSSRRTSRIRSNSPEQSSLLEETWARVQQELQASQNSIRERLSVKRRLADTITRTEQRVAEIEINLSRFEQLERVYRSDIERLEAIEEAGFLLAVGGDKDCPLCGAPPEAQHLAHGLRDIEAAREAGAGRDRQDFAANGSTCAARLRNYTLRAPCKRGDARSCKDRWLVA